MFFLLRRVPVCFGFFQSWSFKKKAGGGAVQRDAVLKPSERGRDRSSKWVSGLAGRLFQVLPFSLVSHSRHVVSVAPGCSPPKWELSGMKPREGSRLVRRFRNTSRNPVRKKTQNKQATEHWPLPEPQNVMQPYKVFK